MDDSKENNHDATPGFKTDSSDVSSPDETMELEGLLDDFRPLQSYHHKQSLAVSGWAREMIFNNNEIYDYNDIITMIASFYSQGFANYFDETTYPDMNCREQMKFGDVLRTKDKIYLVLDNNNELLEVGLEECMDDITDTEGDYSIDIEIPLSICRHLPHAASFYSKIQWRSMKDGCVIRTVKFYITNDDDFVVEYLGDILDSKYQSIAIRFIDNKFIDFRIGVRKRQCHLMLYKMDYHVKILIIFIKLERIRII